MGWHPYLIRIVFLSCCLVLLMSGVSQVQAQVGRKVALLIGNSNYAAVSRLENPVRDVETMATVFRKAGFEVVEVAHDLSQGAFLGALRDFQAKADGAEIGAIFYSGHGMEIAGQNYLLPVDARLRTEVDVEDQGIRLDRVLRTLDRVSKLKLIFLDACRDNPFAPGIRLVGASKNVTRGLARVEPAGSDTLIAYAAKAGTTADDGVGTNSPFTTALATHLLRPGLDIRIALGHVRDDVLSATAQRQEPFTYGSLGGNVPPLVPPDPAPVSIEVPNKPPGPAVPPPSVDEIMWLSIRDRPNAELLRIFIERFPLSPLRAEAEAMLRRIPSPTVPAKATPTAALTTTAPNPFPALPADDKTIRIQMLVELKRLGCHEGTTDVWNAESERSLELFNRQARNPIRIAGLEALQTLRGISRRVCVPRCVTGSRFDGERCSAIVCPAGQALNGDTCRTPPRKPAEAKPKPASRPAPKKATTARKSPPQPGRNGGRCFTFNNSQFCE